MDAQKMIMYRNPPLESMISEPPCTRGTTDSLTHLLRNGMCFKVRTLEMTRKIMNRERMPWSTNDGTKTSQNCDGGGSTQKDKPLFGMLTRCECSWGNWITSVATDPAVHQR